MKFIVKYSVTEVRQETVEADNVLEAQTDVIMKPELARSWTIVSVHQLLEVEAAQQVVEAELLSSQNNQGNSDGPQPA